MRHKKSIFRRFSYWLENSNGGMILFIVFMLLLITLAMALAPEPPIVH